MIVNLTPHEAVLMGADEKVTIPPSGVVARVDTLQEEVERVVVDGVEIPIVATQLGDITGLPEPVDGVLYIASTLVAQAAAQAGRRDVASPDTGPTALRDDQGRIVAVRRLQRPA